MIEDGHRLNKGDILRNDWAGENNPQKYVMFVRREENLIRCLTYDGKIIGLGKHNNKLVVVGHIKEYDDFSRSLRKLKDMRKEGEQDEM